MLNLVLYKHCSCRLVLLSSQYHCCIVLRCLQLFLVPGFVNLDLCIKGLSVNEDYNYLWAVHSFDMEIFEFSVVLFLLLSSENGVSFYWGPAWVNFDSSLFWNCLFTTEKNCGAGISNFNINEFSWTAGNQM